MIDWLMSCKYQHEVYTSTSLYRVIAKHLTPQIIKASSTKNCWKHHKVHHHHHGHSWHSLRFAAVKKQTALLFKIPMEYVYFIIIRNSIIIHSSCKMWYKLYFQDSIRDVCFSFIITFYYCNMTKHMIVVKLLTQHVSSK